MHFNRTQMSTLRFSYTRQNLCLRNTVMASPLACSNYYDCRWTFCIESFRHIQNRVIDELGDIAPITVDTPSSYPSTPPIDPKHIPYSMHLTSVYDHSLQEAFSRVFMRIISSSTLPYVEHLLNTLQTNLSSQKTFLFDTKARFYVATDSSPVDFTTFGLCCDYVHMLNKFGDLYKYVTNLERYHFTLKAKANIYA